MHIIHTYAYAYKYIYIYTLKPSLKKHGAALRRKLAEALGFRGAWDEARDGKVSHGMI